MSASADTFFLSRRQRGFTLVEIIVALTVSLLLLAGVMQLFLSSKNTYNVQDGLSRLQENARFAMNFLSNDMRIANYLGCPQKNDDLGSYRNVLNTPGSFLWDFRNGIRGFEAGSSVDASVNDAAARTDSDVISIKVVRGSGAKLTSTMASTSDASLRVSTGSQAPPQTGDVALITDCTTTTVFQITNITGGYIQHGGAGTPGNSTADLGHRFRIGASIYPVETVTYYTRDSASGNGPALWRRTNDNAPDELIEGVESMQITYGVDTIHASARIADQYRTADAVTDWQRVVSIRVGLLLRTPEEVNPEMDVSTYNVNGVVVDPPDDRRLRRVFNTTIALRNRAP